MGVALCKVEILQEVLCFKNNGQITNGANFVSGIPTSSIWRVQKSYITFLITDQGLILLFITQTYTSLLPIVR